MSNEILNDMGRQIQVLADLLQSRLAECEKDAARYRARREKFYRDAIEDNNENALFNVVEPPMSQAAHYEIFDKLSDAIDAALTGDAK